MPVILVIVVVCGIAIWTGILPLRNFIHTGPISFSVGNAPTLYIMNNARNSSSIRQRDVAPVRISAGNSQETVSIQATNIPWVGVSPITYRQSGDRALTFIEIDYKYKGTIDITVPKKTHITLDSYDNGVEIRGVTGKFLLETYKGNITVTDCVFSAPSLLKSYQGSQTLKNVTLKYGSSFESYMGEINFDGALAPEGHHFFYTHQGKLALTLPATSAFHVDAYSYQQEAVLTDFPGLQPAERGMSGSTGQSPQAYLHLYSYQHPINLHRGKGV